MYRRRMQPEQYFKDGKQRFGMDRSTVTTTDRLQSASGGLVGLLLAFCLPILMGILHLGYEYYLVHPDPPTNLFAFQRNQTGYA